MRRAMILFCSTMTKSLAFTRRSIIVLYVRPPEEHSAASVDPQGGRGDCPDSIREMALVQARIERLLDQRRAVVVAEGCETALRRIGEECGHLPHHNRSHTEGVRRRVGMVLDAFQKAFPERFPAHLKELGDIAASYHDIERGHVKGRNEEMSSEAACAWMKGAAIDGQPLYEESDLGIVHAAIMATVPQFAEGKFAQPHLLQTQYPSDSTRVVSVALALSDIPVGLLEEGDVRLEDSDCRFREKRGAPFQRRLNEAAAGGDPFTTAEWERLRAAILEWDELQVRFSAHLEGPYLEEVLFVFGEDEAMKRVIRELCARPPEERAVEHARRTLERRRGMDPLELARETGFSNVPKMA